MLCNESILKALFHEFKPFKDWILLFEEEAETTRALHPLAISLLKQFQHLLLEDIPFGLPPKRDIQHHIDLIPREILLNKPAYRMNPKRQHQSSKTS